MAGKELTEVHAKGKTHTGKVRSENQDGFITRVPPQKALIQNKGILLAVADGMGGHAAGKIASSMALESLSRDYYYSSPENISDALIQAITKANQNIRNESESDPDKHNMGTTLTAVVLRYDKAWIANVGDSRTYLIRKNKIRQITIDHSMTNELGLSNTDAQTSIFKNQITRALGIYEDVEVDIFVETIQKGDIFILCSDGLTNHLSDFEISHIASKYNPEKAIKSLIKLACDRGGIDNITVISSKIGKVAKPQKQIEESNQNTKKKNKQIKNKTKRSHVWLSIVIPFFIIFMIALAFFYRETLRTMATSLKNNNSSKISNVVNNQKPNLSEPQLSDLLDKIESLVSKLKEKSELQGEAALSDSCKKVVQDIINNLNNLNKMLEDPSKTNLKKSP